LEKDFEFFNSQEEGDNEMDEGERREKGEEESLSKVKHPNSLSGLVGSVDRSSVGALPVKIFIVHLPSQQDHFLHDCLEARAFCG
jgi:hypothetical protein